MSMVGHAQPKGWREIDQSIYGIRSKNSNLGHKLEGP